MCARLMIAGGIGRSGRYAESLRRLVAANGLGDRVTFLGEVTQEGLAELMSAADVFCLASSTEGWPNVVNEALACGHAGGRNRRRRGSSDDCLRSSTDRSCRSMIRRAGRSVALGSDRTTGTTTRLRFTEVRARGARSLRRSRRSEGGHGGAGLTLNSLELIVMAPGQFGVRSLKPTSFAVHGAVGATN